MIVFQKINEKEREYEERKFPNEQQLNENVCHRQAYRNLTGSQRATSTLRADILRKRKAKGNCNVIMTACLYVFSEGNKSK